MDETFSASPVLPSTFKILRVKFIRPPPMWIEFGSGKDAKLELDLIVGISDDYGVEFNGGRVKLHLRILDIYGQPIDIITSYTDVFDTTHSSFHPLKLSLRSSSSLRPTTIRFELSAEAMDDCDGSNLSDDSIKMLGMIGESGQRPYSHWNGCRYVLMRLSSGPVELRVVKGKGNVSEKKVQTVIRQLHLDSFTINLIERPGLNNSTGQRIWDCAIGLTLFFATRRSIFSPISNPSTGKARKNTILELGAGLGLVGMVCSTIQSGPVVCTDVAVTVETSLAENLMENSSQKIQEIRLEVLDWGVVSNEVKSKLIGTDSNVILVGSDILYNPESHSLLLETLLSFLVDSISNRAYIAYQARTEGDDEFFGLAKKAGLSVEMIWEWDSIQVYAFSG